MGSSSLCEQQKYEAAICLARMYEVREILEPVVFLESEIIVNMVLQWTDEYLDSDCDIVEFFESHFQAD